jgi:hypothetical protein
MGIECACGWNDVYAKFLKNIATVGKYHCYSYVPGEYQTYFKRTNNS